MDSSQAISLACLAQELPLQCDPATDILQVSCLDKIKWSLIKGSSSLGYEYVRYSYWLKNIAPGNITTNAFSVNFSNFPSSWENLYNDEHMYLHDPVVRIIQEKINSQKLIYGSWGDAYLWAVQQPLGETDAQKQDYLHKTNKLIADASLHNLAAGFYYSWGDSIRQIVLSLASGKPDDARPERISIQMLHSIMILINQSIMDTHGCQLCNKSLRIDGSNQIKLSKTEVYILTLYNLHKNSCQKQIAEKSGRTIDTINHHLRSIRVKLKMSGASGHALAAYASELNLL